MNLSSCRMLLVSCRNLKKLRNIHKKKQLLLNSLFLLYTTTDNENSSLARRKKRAYWVRPMFMPVMRFSHGCSDNVIKEMRYLDREKYFNFFRLTPEMFDELLKIVGPKITRKQCITDPISPKMRLEITLRYLASGDSMSSLQYLFRVAPNTISGIIAETCFVIWDSLKDQVFVRPTEENWDKIAEEFSIKWNFPNCLGAIDGKHVVMQAPSNSGSKYYNFKKSHSIVLLALVDANLCFILVDVGACGRQSDGGILRNSEIGQGFQQNVFNIPPPKSLDNSSPPLPYVLIGDEAFPLSEHMLRPYPSKGSLDRVRKVFNYRLSRARRVVESAFGILASKWRIFRKPIIAEVSTVEYIIRATTCLHNFIMKFEAYRTEMRYSNISEEDINIASSFTGLTGINRTGSNTYTRQASKIRDCFAKYFCENGVVEWQWEKALQNDF